MDTPVGGVDGTLEERLADILAAVERVDVVWDEPSLADGFVAVADFFGDEVPDVVVVHAGSVSIRRGTDGTVLFGPIAMPGGGRGGPPTIADFDGDTRPEIGVAGGAAYAVFDPDGPDGIASRY